MLVPAVSVHDAEAVAVGLAHEDAHGGAAAHVLHLRPGLPGEEPPGAARAHPPRGQTLQVLAVRLRQLAPRQAQGTLQQTPRPECIRQSPVPTQAAEDQARKGTVTFLP